MGIGKRLKEARETASLTQEELAKLVGVTPSAITNYEKETSHPKEPVMYALLNALKVEPNFLFQDCVKIAPLHQSETLLDDEWKLINNYRQLNEEGKEKLLDNSIDLVFSGRYKKHNEGILGSKEA